MKADEPSLLPRERCLALLTSVPIGRVVYTDRALPAVMPANFVLDGDGVTLFTGSDAALGAAVRGAVVAFQADDVDPVSMAGWSVTLIGQAVLLDRAGDVEHLTGLSAWARGRDGQFVHIPARQVSGSRFGPHPLGGTTGTPTPRQAEGPGGLWTSGR